ncbi:MAG: hypothetical protein NZ521_05065 [Flammeovirgaceae bacterium]|nr:hypothetical protein [Flammeovirgaceae bacterium]
MMIFRIILLLGLALVGCEEKITEPPLPPRVILGSTESEANRGDKVIIQVTFAAEAGVKLITINDNPATGYDDVPFQTKFLDYVIPLTQPNGNIPIKFGLIDKQNREASATYTIRVVNAVPKIQLNDGTKLVTSYAVTTKRDKEVPIIFEWVAKEGVKEVRVIDERGTVVRVFEPNELTAKTVRWRFTPSKFDTRTRIELRHFVSDIKGQVSTPPALLFINLLPYTLPTLTFDGFPNNIQFISNATMLFRFFISVDIDLKFQEMRIFKNGQPYETVSIPSSLASPNTFEYRYLVSETAGQNLTLSFQLVDDANQTSNTVNLVGTVK